MTVSRVMTDPLKVGEETRNRIKEIMERMNYLPNRSARMLSGAKQLHIGLLYNLPRSSYIVDFLLGALDHASVLDVQLVSRGCRLGVDAGDILLAMSRSGIDALILTAPFCDSPPLLDIVRGLDIPTLLVSTDNKDIEASAIFIDERAAAFEMTKHLISLGHERIGFILGEPTLAASQVRLEGFKSALSAAGIAFDPQLVAQGHFTYRSGLSATEELLILEKPPTAIFASNDDMAAAAIMTAHRLGFDVPKQLTICGFDDSWIATMIYPELTTIQQPIHEMAIKGLSLIVDQVQEYRAGIRQVRRLKLPYELIIRQSDALPALR